jgi:hypothetical protein
MKLINLRDNVISKMPDMENSVFDEEQFDDAVNQFNNALRDYRNMLTAMYNKNVYNLDSKLLENNNDFA